MEREACVCDHGFERSDLCAEIIIMTIIITRILAALSSCSVSWTNECSRIKKSAKGRPGKCNESRP